MIERRRELAVMVRNSGRAVVQGLAGKINIFIKPASRGVHEAL